MLLPDTAPRHELRESEGFLMAQPAGPQVLPRFPDAVAPEPAPVVVCVRMTVTEDGDTTDLTWLDGVADCPPTDQLPARPFLDAVTSAVASWQFFAAAMCRAPDSAGAVDACDHPQVEIEPVAIYLAYRFEFTADGTRMSTVDGHGG